MSQKLDPARRMTRRQFLQTVGAAAAGAVLAGCQPAPTPTPSATPTLKPSATPEPTATKTFVPTRTPDVNAPTSEVAATSTASVPYLPEAQVVVGQQIDYDRKAVRACLEKMLGDMWKFKDIVPAGAKVAIKVNLTGGISAYQMEGVPAVESVATHPEVVRALGELLLDAGAGQLYIVESVYEWQSYTDWGYEEIAKSLNAKLIDLNAPDPYPDFASVPVGERHMIYENFMFNRILTEVDTFISVAKMKCHIECGVTHSMKNLVGLVPFSLYRADPKDGNRSAFHADSKTRLPRIVVDLNMARPIHLSVIDGIKTIEAGEGTWAEGVKQVKPGLLFAGKNALATDTVATAVMGFDPTVRYPSIPFTRADNYLNIAYNLELGTNLLEKIDLLGPAIKDISIPFQPATGYKS